MCGISGLIHKSSEAIDRGLLQKMNRLISHRGPDDEGYFFDGPVGLAHRRLSIIDIGGGHQPISSEDGRFIIVFNGEIYNFQKLRADLESQGHSFKTNSDTEVLLELFISEGPVCLPKLNGMFAFAIWDKLEEKLFLARDRMGKKPLYFWNHSDHFAFASEIKVFRPHPKFSSELNPLALSHFFQYEYVPAPYAIYNEVQKLPAAHYMIYHKGEVQIQPYWDIPLMSSEPVSEEEAQKKIVTLLDEAVQARMISDVPLGVFLSGGIDSSSIVALMARHKKGKDIKTFSIGFKEKSFDESDYATQIAQKFGTDHSSEILTASKMLTILPEVMSFLDEPFADYSILPTYLLSQFTRQKVTVALGGDGSDEIFAGYPTFQAAHLAQKYKNFPVFSQKLLKFFVERLPVSDNDISFDFKLKQFLYGVDFPPVIQNQIWLGAFHQKEQNHLFSDGFLELLKSTNSFCDPLDRVKEVMDSCPSQKLGDRILYFYQKFYLCGDILVKTDRASMANSLEVRAPYLDPHLVEYVSGLPYDFKLRGKENKYILKKALEGLVPDNILYRPKKGFGIPIAIWLRNELKEEVLRLLDPSKIKKEGIFNPSYINQLVNEHLSKKKNNRKQLFSLLTFHWWKENYLSG